MRYALLSTAFYERYKNCEEILQKTDRPYCIVIIKINDLTIGIPFRSHIKHKYAFFTEPKNPDTNTRGGLDFTKAVVLALEKDIDTERKAFIRKTDYKKLLGREYRVEQGFVKFLAKYREALQYPERPENKGIVNNSALKYFHKELGIRINKGT